jgi:hypothetical protein
MALEYLDPTEAPEEVVEAIHNHLCDNCGLVLAENCIQDCDDDTYEVCPTCSIELEGESIEVEKVITDIEKEKTN